MWSHENGILEEYLVKLENVYNKFTISTTWRIKSRFIILASKVLHNYGLLHNYTFHLTSLSHHTSSTLLFSLFRLTCQDIFHCQDFALSVPTSWKSLPYIFTWTILSCHWRGPSLTTYFPVYPFIILCIASYYLILLYLFLVYISTLPTRLQAPWKQGPCISCSVFYSRALKSIWHLVDAHHICWMNKQINQYSFFNFKNMLILEIFKNIKKKIT